MDAVKITERLCKGCGICVAFCPTGALVLEHEKARTVPDKCIACGLCELYCPDLAIIVDKSLKPSKKAKEVKS